MKRDRKPGLVVAALVAAGLAGCSSTGGGGVVVTNLPPDAAFDVSQENPSRNEVITFDASTSTDPEGEIVEYRWSFDGDTVFEDVGPDTVVTHSYATPGQRSVLLKLEDDAGNTASTSHTVTVKDNFAPLAGFTFSPVTPAVDEAITFDGTDAQDSDGTVVEYRWDFDDDGTYDDITALTTTVHSFAGAGDHTVVLEVVDDDGALGRTTRTVAVSSG